LVGHPRRINSGALKSSDAVIQRFLSKGTLNIRDGRRLRLHQGGFTLKRVLADKVSYFAVCASLSDGLTTGGTNTTHNAIGNKLTEQAKTATDCGVLYATVIRANGL
jgi:hypothetical protein